MWRRLKNLWAWSNVSPATSYADVFSPIYHPAPQPKGRGAIIQANDPADELLKTIRQEDSRQA